MKILIVEDESSLRESIIRFLQREDYLCEEAGSYDLAFEKCAIYEYDLIVLDLTLPGGNGLDLLDGLRRDHPRTGILIISARNTLDDRLKGLDLGADDYLTKPFHLAELNSRIKAIIRRRSFEGNARIIYGEISLDPATHEVLVNDSILNLTRKEFELLLYMMTNSERVLSREAIAEHIWGDQIDNADNFDFLYTHIKNLRQKIRSAGGRNYLRSVYGTGYQLRDQ